MPPKSPFISAPLLSRQSFPHMGRSCLLSRPASTHLAPAPTTQHPGHLQSSLTNATRHYWSLIYLMAAAHCRQALPRTVLRSRVAPRPLGLVCCLAADAVCCCSTASTQVLPLGAGTRVAALLSHFSSSARLSVFRKCAVFTFGLVEKPCFACSAPARD